MFSLVGPEDYKRFHWLPPTLLYSAGLFNLEPEALCGCMRADSAIPIAGSLKKIKTGSIILQSIFNIFSKGLILLKVKIHPESVVSPSTSF